MQIASAPWLAKRYVVCQGATRSDKLLESCSFSTVGSYKVSDVMHDTAYICQAVNLCTQYISRDQLS